MKRLAVCALLVTLALPACAQNITFDKLLSGKDTALTLKLKDLNGDWRHVSIGGMDKPKGGMGDMLGPLMQLGAMGAMGDKNKKKDDAASTMLGMQFLSSMFGGAFGGGGSKDPVYYTKGDLAYMGSEAFLIAYTYHKPTVDLLKLAADSEKNGGKDPDFTKMAGDGKMTADSVLSLTLLNTKTIGTLSDIRPFDMNAEIADSASSGGGLMDLMALGAKSTAKDEGDAKAAPVLEASIPKVTPTVNKAILNDGKLMSGGNKINIDANDDTNVLTIRGSVANEAQRQRASAIAKKALADMGSDMVVHNNLTVRGAAHK